MQPEQTEIILAARLRQQAVVAQLSQTALQELDLQVLFDQAVQLISESLEIDYAKVLELCPDGRSLRLRAGCGWRAGLVGQATVDTDLNSQAGYTLRSQTPVIVKDLRSETRFQGPPLLTDHCVISGVSTIIPNDVDRPFGVLGAHSTQRYEFTQDDVNFLQAIANLLAAAIERRHTEAQLRELNRTLEERVRDRTQALEAVNCELEAFSYTIAHDIRAPLRAIQGFAKILQEDYAPNLDELGEEYIDRMATSAEYLDCLIQDLLTYSQLDRAPISLRKVDPNLVLQQALQDLMPTIQTQAAQVEVADPLPQVYANPTVLRQVFDNLLHNALKFVPTGVSPQVRLWAEMTPPENKDSSPPFPKVRIWIQDNGIGIAKRHQQRIFKPFERLHGVDAFPGTGIGLSIVRRAVRRMGGSVGVKSAENQGSRFWVEFRAGVAHSV